MRNVTPKDIALYALALLRTTYRGSLQFIENRPRSILIAALLVFLGWFISFLIGGADLVAATIPSLLSAAGSYLILAISVVLSSLLLAPVRIFRDQQERLDAFARTPKPNLTIKPFNPGQAKRERWVGIIVMNDSDEELTECIAWLQSVVKIPDNTVWLTRPEELVWSPENAAIGIAIPAGGTHGADVGVTHSDENVFCSTLARGNVDKKTPGKYKVEITIQGIYQKKRFHQSFHALISYSGGTDLTIQAWDATGAA